MSKLFYYFGMFHGIFVQLFFLKTKCYYEDDTRQNKSIKGSAIIISNHHSAMDGIVIALKYFFKRLHFIVADFYKNRMKVAKFFIKLTGGILVDFDREGNNLDFIEKSRKLTSKGRAILIFPEGDFKFSYEPSKFALGYIMLAIKTGTKIVPIVNDFNYGFFKRVHLMIGNSIDLSGYCDSELTKALLKEINEKISAKYMMLFYRLKRIKALKFSNKYEFSPPNKGDVIRISVDSHYHYGIYLNTNEVIQFGHSVNRKDENIVVNSVSLKEFCGAKIPEVRTHTRSEKRRIRNACDIEKYAKSCLGKGGYSLTDNNCLDFANRVTLKI